MDNLDIDGYRWGQSTLDSNPCCFRMLIGLQLASLLNRDYHVAIIMDDLKSIFSMLLFAYNLGYFLGGI